MGSNEWDEIKVGGSKVAQDALDAFRGIMSEAKEDSSDFLREHARTVEDWVVKLSKKQIDREEFNHLINAQKRTVTQYLNTEEIKSKVKLKTLIDSVLDASLQLAVHFLKREK